MMDKPLILAVDDEVEFLEIVSLYLNSSGFRSVTITTLKEEELVHRCEELHPALVLLDVYLSSEPIGLSFAAALKKNPHTAQVKVILWSSGPLPEASSAADDFFSKGEDLGLLMDKIRRQIPAALIVA